MSIIICPVCGEKLYTLNREALCRNNHHFDRAKQGYLNLLISQSSSLAHHGDDRLMVEERRNFLEQGYYSHLRDETAKLVCDYAPSDCTILDCGCGEGYYSKEFYSYLTSNGRNVNMLCVDISKEAAKLMARCDFPHETLVASAYNLPVESESCDMLINIFAPVAAAEFSRVLKNSGVLLRVLPKQKHLYELKCSVYENPYDNPEVDTHLEGFDFITSKSVDYEININSNEDIMSLFKMTPYYYKTSKDDQKKLDKLESLTTRLSFEIVISKKEGK